jgi:arylsulfatase A-like enzyme
MMHLHFVDLWTQETDYVKPPMTLKQNSFAKFFFGRTSFLQAATVLAVAGWWMVSPLSRPVAATETDQPNVLLVITDDQGYGDIGYNGNEMIQTPNLDAFAKQSVRFTDFHVCATCAETRAALMTGRYPMRSGVWHTIMGRSLLDPRALTLPQILSSAGYRTGMFGKWHLGDNAPLRPFERGFETTLAHGGGGVTQLPDYWGNDYFDDTYFRNGQPESQDGYCTDVFFNAATEFIDRDDAHPWFCYLATNAPHSPYNVASQYSEPYTAKGVPDPMAAFYGMITNIDENFGRLMKHLDAKGELDNTLIIFMSDNGSAAGLARKSNGKQPTWAGFNAGMRGTKGSQYDGGHRVPFFVRPPNRANGQTDRSIEQLAAHIDVLPTIADYCNVELPNEYQSDGQSLVPLLTSNSDSDWPDRSLFVQIQRIDQPEKWRKCSVMTERYRLINGKQLFDIVTDPGQVRDIADENPTVVSELRDQYETWWGEVSKTTDDFVYISLGMDSEPIARLTSHDWHENTVWSQQEARRDPPKKGPWRVRFEQAGNYRLTGRIRPMNVQGKLAAESATIEVQMTNGEVVKSKKLVQVNEEQVVWELEIPAGTATLETTLESSSGTERGCYFVYVEFID